MSEPKPTTAFWHIALNCDCPKCGEYVDLLDYVDFWDGNNLNLGENGTSRSNHLETPCPKCGEDIEVCCEY